MSPTGTAERTAHDFRQCPSFCFENPGRLCGTWNVCGFNPALKCRAIVIRRPATTFYLPFEKQTASYAVQIQTGSVPESFG
jgi:hypothetical protein